MKKTWYEIYMEEIKAKGTINNYVTDKIKTKKALIDLIKKYSPNKKIIEAGSGTGILSTYMASLGYETTAIDIDKDILKLSQKISAYYGSKNKPIFKMNSILELNYKENQFDVSFSNGVLEHFSDVDIINTLKKQMKISKVVIFGIPTKYFDDSEAMYGNERFLKLNFWREIINKSGGKILEEKSCHFLRKYKIPFDFRIYHRPFPYRIFVIEENKNQN
jgi:2-polyprenyl-3-methyl-5-hydroxy-6-metoxy-1,4-benzoquinol methylase